MVMSRAGIELLPNVGHLAYFSIDQSILGEMKEGPSRLPFNRILSIEITTKLIPGHSLYPKKELGLRQLAGMLLLTEEEPPLFPLGYY